MTTYQPPITEQMHLILNAGCRHTVMRRVSKTPFVQITFPEESIEQLKRLVARLEDNAYAEEEPTP